MNPRLLLLILILMCGCSKKQEAQPSDSPRVNADVRIQDVRFFSAAMQREMNYRVVIPVRAQGKKLATLYLLHGGGGAIIDWTNYSDVALLTAPDLLLVMPQGDSSYYLNSAERPQDKYEDFVTADLIADVEAKFPVTSDRRHRFIAGVSMGGFGAVTLALKHPDLYAFAGGISSAIDVPHRPFSIRRIDQWKHHKSIFGDWESEGRKSKDPFLLAQQADPKTAPYFFLTCGDKEGLLPSNKQFADLLKKRGLASEFHQLSGGHDWNQWNAELPVLFAEIRKRLN